MVDKAASARTIPPKELLKKEDVVILVDLPVGPLGVRFHRGTTIKEVKEESPLAGKVHAGEKVIAVTRPGIQGSVNCADMTDPNELTEVLHHSVSRRSSSLLSHMCERRRMPAVTLDPVQ